ALLTLVRHNLQPKRLSARVLRALACPSPALQWLAAAAVLGALPKLAAHKQARSAEVLTQRTPCE
ncbi:hypothetical protein, conserved in T. vivax, partial [Trypanosoma vivax Y486]